MEMVKTFFTMDRDQLFRLMIIAGCVVALDQITKTVILNSLPLHHAITVIPGFFNITHVHNPGGAFGVFADQGPLLRKTVFLFMASVAVVFVYYFYKNTSIETHPWLSRGLALIFGGAIGNLVDRFRFGKVIDFLDFYVGNLHWPAFNVADSAISVGVGIFVLHLVFNKMPE